MAKPNPIPPTQYQLVHAQTSQLAKEGTLPVKGAIDTKAEAQAALELFKKLENQDQYKLVVNGDHYYAANLQNILKHSSAPTKPTAPVSEGDSDWRIYASLGALFTGAGLALAGGLIAKGAPAVNGGQQAGGITMGVAGVATAVGGALGLLLPAIKSDPSSENTPTVGVSIIPAPDGASGGLEVTW